MKANELNTQHTHNKVKSNSPEQWESPPKDIDGQMLTGFTISPLISQQRHLYKTRTFKMSKSPQSKSKSKSKSNHMSIPIANSPNNNSKRLSPLSYCGSIQTSLRVRSPDSMQSQMESGTEDMALIMSGCDDTNEYNGIVMAIGDDEDTSVELVQHDIDRKRIEYDNMMVDISENYVDSKRAIMGSDDDQYLSPSETRIKQNIFSIGLNLKRMQSMGHSTMILAEADEYEDDFAFNVSQTIEKVVESD